ncbi:MAG: hypothetical protein CMC98_05500 [Flavobacteriales bacterium]|nr:hypothetical protein [Flavobacteriales bacterium]
MNYIDVIISIAVLYGIFKGFTNGIIKEITNIVSVCLAIYLGFHFSSIIEPYLKTNFLSSYENIVPLFAFLIVFIVIIVIIKSIGELIDRLTKLLALGLVSRFLGAIFGMVKVLIICSFFHFIAIKFGVLNDEHQKNSVLIKPLQQVYYLIIPEINKQKNDFWQKANENTERLKEEFDKKINQE